MTSWVPMHAIESFADARERLANHRLHCVACGRFVEVLSAHWEGGTALRWWLDCPLCGCQVSPTMANQVGAPLTLDWVEALSVWGPA